MKYSDFLRAVKERVLTPAEALSGVRGKPPCMCDAAYQARRELGEPLGWGYGPRFRVLVEVTLRSFPQLHSLYPDSVKGTLPDSSPVRSLTGRKFEAWRQRVRHEWLDDQILQAMRDEGTHLESDLLTLARGLLDKGDRDGWMFVCNAISTAAQEHLYPDNVKNSALDRVNASIGGHRTILDLWEARGMRRRASHAWIQTRRRELLVMLISQARKEEIHGTGN